jgi:two-component system cell cycle sensor histidine kinase PleC
LDFSKIEAGKMEFHEELLDVMPLVKDCCEEWRLQANVKKIKLELKAPHASIMLWVDKIRFLQILTNLINNAIKFTPEYGKIEICIEDKTDVCQFSISDTGSGIAEPDLPKLFQKFQQLRRSPGPGAQGTGLGLSIMKSLVELHGGRVSVESQVGKGTTFRFTIPKARIHNTRQKVSHVA